MFKSITLLFSSIVFLLASNSDFSNQEIHNAIRNSNIPMIEYLLKNSRKTINEKDDLGYTPIHLAVRKNETDIIKYLLKYNPDLNTMDKFGDTPLIDSARNNNIEVVKLLICGGADKYVKNNNGKTAMDFISDNKQYETALFMKNPKCNVDKEKEKKNLIEKLRKLK